MIRLKRFLVVLVLGATSTVLSGTCDYCDKYEGGYYVASATRCGWNCSEWTCLVERCTDPLGYTDDCTGFVSCPAGGG